MLTVDSKSDIHILNEITALVERGFEE
jgi:hypothetical protein